jgi:NAD(P)-dependent dehydrogenase (short-subunit alcohol dehydrogenase family)
VPRSIVWFRLFSLEVGIVGLMKSAALELGKYKITVNALVPGLIDIPLTRHEERYAQALDVAGRTPTGNPQKDEENAKKILQAKSPLGVPWIDLLDLGSVVVFPAPDAARMVSGSTYDESLHLRQAGGRRAKASLRSRECGSGQALRGASVANVPAISGL